MVKCGVHGTEHGSDHPTIEPVFDISVPVPNHQELLLLKNAPWKEIRDRITSSFYLTCLTTFKVTRAVLRYGTPTALPHVCLGPALCTPFV